MTLAELQIELVRRGATLTMRRKDGQWAVALLAGHSDGFGYGAELEDAITVALASFDNAASHAVTQ